MENLFKWAREADQPLRTYSTGLLGGAMENQDIAANYRDENSQLVRTILDFFFFLPKIFTCSFLLPELSAVPVAHGIS